MWDKHIDDPLLEDYFRGDINLNEFMEQIDFYGGHKVDLDKITSVKELEDYCRDNNLVNFYGN